MNNLDILLVAAIVIGFITGYFKGLISQLSTGAGIVIGIMQAILFYTTISEKIMSATGWSHFACNLLAFVGIIIIAVLIFKIAGWLISALLKVIHLNFINKILGALFSTCIAILLVVGATISTQSLLPGVEMFGKESQSKSKIYKYAQDATLSALGEVKKEINEKKQ